MLSMFLLLILRLEKNVNPISAKIDDIKFSPFNSFA